MNKNKNYKEKIQKKKKHLKRFSVKIAIKQ